MNQFLLLGGFPVVTFNFIAYVEPDIQEIYAVHNKTQNGGLGDTLKYKSICKYYIRKKANLSYFVKNYLYK